MTLAASGVLPPGVILGTATASGTIDDDDPLTAAVSVASEVTEGEPAEFTVTLTGGTSTAPVVVSFTVGGTATAGTDYAAPAPPATLAIGAGESSGMIRIDTIADGVSDPGETLVVSLSGARTTVGTVTVDSSAASATSTIADAGPATVSMARESAAEDATAQFGRMAGVLAADVVGARFEGAQGRKCRSEGWRFVPARRGSSPRDRGRRGRGSGSGIRHGPTGRWSGRGR